MNHLAANSAKKIRAFPAGLALGIALLIIVAAGCASQQASKQLEGVAKGWCEMIRASQVIPVYPLTEDLSVGDVFLVQTPISDQASDYKKKGFLPLDDALVRLPYTDYTKVYFNGYWTNNYGLTPHNVPTFTNYAAFGSNQAVLLTDAPLPRAAFPTYSVQAQSGFGFNAAFPIQGIPVALSYLNSQQVNASITIADARTYAGDRAGLLTQLHVWGDAAAIKKELKEIAKNAAPTRIFLRVVSRVYYARTLDVSLQRSGTQGAGGKGGTVNDVSLLKPNGTVNENYTNLLGALTASASGVASTAQVGGAVKFVSASSSSVGLSQSFDRLLAIGYLGFDCPVNTNGDIGVPIPTWQYLNGKIPTPPQAEVQPTPYGADSNTVLIRAWLNEAATPSHVEQLRNWLGPAFLSQFGFTTVLDAAQFASLRTQIIDKFGIKP